MLNAWLGWVRRAAHEHKILVCSVLLLSVTELKAAGTSLIWDASADPNVAGYRIYYSQTSSNYSQYVSAGLNSSVTLSNLVEGATYFFVATAVTAQGLESDYSAEVSYTVPTGRPTEPTPTTIQLTIRTSGKGTTSPEPGTQTLIAGQTYTVNAKPHKGHKFKTWAGAMSSTNLSMTFVATSDLELEADFVEGEIDPLQANYYGLFYETNEVRQVSAGAITVSSTARKTYTGRVQIGSKRYSFRGQFDDFGHGTNVIQRRDAAALTLRLKQSPDGETDIVSGQITDGTWTSEVLANRTVFHSRTNPAMLGTFTLVLPGQEEKPGEPVGHGYAVAKVNSSGSVTLAGALADGTRFSGRAPLSPQKLVPLYVSLYAGQGSLVSWLAFTNAPEYDLAGALSWIKPMNPRSRYYPSGFSYVCESIGSSFRGPTALTGSQALATFENAPLSLGFANEISLGYNNRVTNLSSNKLSLSFAGGTGVFRGKVADPSTGLSSSFRGVVLQKVNTAYGFMLGNGQSSSVNLTPHP